jgi:hypothetical protein
MITEFFGNIAQRWRDENALSDMTWAMAETSATFRQALIKFFDFEVNPASPVDVERETTIDAGRPDFKIKDGERFFIVENKIYDRDYHIKQYCGTKEKRYAGLGLITNHPLDFRARQEVDEYKVRHRTWQQLMQALKHQLDTFTDAERPCVEAYVAYVQEVCNMVHLQRIDIAKLQSLYHFVFLMREVLERLEHRRASFKYLRTAASDCYSGCYFELTLEGEEKKYWPWAGVYFKDSQPSIYFFFRKSSDPEIYERWKDRSADRAIMKIKDIDSEIQMFLKDNEFMRFTTGNLESQRELLTEFATAVVDEIYNIKATTESPML